jgi:hypothetical protein
MVIAAINTLYFTGFSLGGTTLGGNSIIYFIPSFFLFTFWIACGIHFFSSLNYRYYAKAVSRIIIIVLTIWLFFSQMPGHFYRSCIFPVTEFVTSSFNDLPKNTVVIARWSKIAPLLYFQKVHNLRQDLIIIEYGPGKIRHYDSGSVTGDYNYINKQMPHKSVVIDRMWPDLRNKFRFMPINKNWFNIEPLSTGSVNG